MRQISSSIYVLFVCLLLSCSSFMGERINGNGVLKSEQVQVGDFSRVEANGAIDVILNQSSTPSVKIEADENLLEYLDVRVGGSRLIVGTKRGFNLNSRTGIKVYASAPLLEEVEVAGSGNIRSLNKLTHPQSIKASIAGSGNIDMEVDAPSVAASIAGSGTANISGTTQNFKAEVAGSGDILSYNLMSENTKVELSGSGKAEVYASKKLTAQVNGSGDVYYKGSPSVSQQVNGSGSVSKVD